MRKIIYILFMVSIFCCGCKASSVVVERSPDDSGKTDNEEVYTSEEYASPESDLYAVYVCGAVKKPDVYYVEAGSIVADVLKLAGGFDDGACEWYVNLAEYVKAGTRIYFPYESEVGEDVPKDENCQSDDSSESGLVNINKAGKDELMTLNGVGESRAEAIIGYREEHGDFKDISEICNVSGIKDGLYNKIKDYITVD